MENMFLFTVLSLLFLFLAYKLYRPSSRHKNLPPSPPSLPIIGHLFLLKRPIHQVMHKLSQKYGPILSLKLGPQLAVVVTSLSAAEECFTKNDIVLANRPMSLMGKHLGYNHTTLIAAPYGEHWRNLRRISSDDIFSISRLNMFQSTRKDEIKHLVMNLSRDSRQGFSKVEMKSKFKDLTFNNIMRMVAGKRYYGDDDVTNKEDAKEFKELIDELFKYGGASNPEDFLPILSWITGFRYEKKMTKLAKLSDNFAQGLIDEHRNMHGDLERVNTMVNHLLSLQRSQPEYYTDEIIKGLAMLMIVTGTDTSAATLEWALSNLVNHPDILEKAFDELSTQVGQERLVDESDLSKLEYLQNIIQETFRLYPTAPLLVPHYSSSDCTIEGFHVPRDTIVLVSAWSIQKDPTLWEDPLSFKPERFNKCASKDGSINKLLTFGMGRRSCPGGGLAQRIVGLTLASLIQCFEWQRVTDQKVDMREGEGISMPKAEPLEVLCKARPIIANIFT